jgi:hypothetical protein
MDVAVPKPGGHDEAGAVDDGGSEREAVSATSTQFDDLAIPHDHHCIVNRCFYG